MDPVTLVTEGWEVRVLEARSFIDRWRGVKRVSGSFPVLLRARSVHGLGLEDPLLVAAIDAGMRVCEIRTLRPGHFLTLPDAKYVLEMPIGWEPPPPGSVLELRRG